MSAEIINFQVTQKDINNGKGGDCGSCAIALAVSRRLKTPVKVGTASFQPSHFSMDSIMLPREIIKFIRTFDTQKRSSPGQLGEFFKPVKPIRFSVAIPIKWLEEFARKRKIWLTGKKKGINAIPKTINT